MDELDSILDEVWGESEETEESTETETEAKSNTEETVEEGSETDQPEAKETETEESMGDEEQKEEKQTEADQQKEAPKTFTLKHMNETRQVGENEVVALAQKGMDYDRIREERDSLRNEKADSAPHIAELESIAKFFDEVCAASKMDRQSFMDATRANMLVEQEKEKGRELSPELALELAVKERERQSAAGTEPKAKEEPKAEQEEPAESVEQSRQKDEFTAFVIEYPEVDPKDIPQSVWDEFRQGGSLTTAYAKYENNQLKEKLKALEQNQKNRERSTGSRQSSGGGKSSFDAEIDAIWS